MMSHIKGRGDCSPPQTEIPWKTRERRWGDIDGLNNPTCLHPTVKKFNLAGTLRLMLGRRTCRPGGPTEDPLT
jgi:hypothetical protein